eukprot:TRINITY_DN5543_c0_g1_i7.p1 TRINITY_DN5543_c0_g1~~TRINITY_DN5543_c0_g1_i7.p1  ORF type:complete len:1224 (-),score=261.63 TRINITY_DN5543_c0_g1_i7:2094-5675(-)
MAHQQDQDASKEVDIDDQDVKLGPGWMHKEKRITKKQRPKSEFEYSKEELLSFRAPNSVIPFDSAAVPHIASEEALTPVNLSPQQLKEFEQLQQRFKNNISPALGRGRGRGRGRGAAPVGGGRGRGEVRRESLGRKGDPDALKTYRTPRERSGEPRGSAGSERGGFRRYSMDQSWGKRDMFGFSETERGRGSGRGRREVDDEEDEYGLYNDDFESERADEGKELRTPPGLENLKRWYYEDPQKVVRGPFTDREMNDWFLAGYFPKTLPIRKEDESEFVPLGTCEGNPFAPIRPKVGSIRSVADKDRKANQEANWARASREKRPQAESSEDKTAEQPETSALADSTPVLTTVQDKNATSGNENPPSPLPGVSEPSSKTISVDSKPVQQSSASITKPAHDDTPSRDQPPEMHKSITEPTFELKSSQEPSFELESTQEPSWDTLMDSYDDLSADTLDPLADDLDAQEKNDAAAEPQDQSIQEPLSGPSNHQSFGGRKAWDVHELERQFESLEQDEEVNVDLVQHQTQPRNPYSNQMAPQHMHQPSHSHHPQHPRAHPQMQAHFYQQPYLPPQLYMQQPRPMEKLERIQGVYDMASLEEQLLRQSTGGQSGVSLAVQSQPAPWVVPENAGGGQQVRSLRQIQEMEMQERQRQAYERAQHEHRQAQFRAETGEIPRGSPKPTPFQAVWGHDFAGLSLQDIQAKIQQEHEEETKANLLSPSAHDSTADADIEDVNDSDNGEQQQPQQQPQQQESRDVDVTPFVDIASQKTSQQKRDPTVKKHTRPKEDIDIWAASSPSPNGQSTAATQTTKKPSKQPSQTSGKQTDNRRGGSGTAINTNSNKAPKNAWGTGTKENPGRKLTLKEIQELEQAERQQREALERDHHRQQAATRNPPPVWGLTSDSPASLQSIQQDQAAQQEHHRLDSSKSRVTHAAPEPEFIWGSVHSEEKTSPDSKHIKPRLDQIQQEQRSAAPKKEPSSRPPPARSGWGSPWTAEPVAAQPLSIREIQEQEAIQRRNDEARKKQLAEHQQQQVAQTQDSAGIARLLWSTDNVTEAPPSLNDIIQQERKQRPKPASASTPTPAGPTSASASALSSAPSGWQIPTTSEKPSLREIQHQEVKQKTSAAPKIPQKKTELAPQSKLNKSPEPHNKKAQPVSTQTTKRKSKVSLILLAISTCSSLVSSLFDYHPNSYSTSFSLNQ